MMGRREARGQGRASHVLSMSCTSPFPDSRTGGPSLTLSARFWKLTCFNFYPLKGEWKHSQTASRAWTDSMGSPALEGLLGKV